MIKESPHEIFDAFCHPCDSLCHPRHSLCHPRHSLCHPRDNGDPDSLLRGNDKKDEGNDKTLKTTPVISVKTTPVIPVTTGIQIPSFEGMTKKTKGMTKP